MGLGIAFPGLESQTYMTSALYPGGCVFEYLHFTKIQPFFSLSADTTS